MTELSIAQVSMLSSMFVAKRVPEIGPSIPSYPAPTPPQWPDTIYGHSVT